VSATGRVESIALTTSSGDADLDAATLRSLESARFTPASRDGEAVSVCNQQVTVHVTEPATPP
jgi:TonB family protein